MAPTRYVEPLLPKISLLSLIGLVTASAFAMGIIRHAILTGELWAILATAAIAGALIPIFFYVGSFVLAILFSTVGAVASVDDAEETIHTPTIRMPEEPQ